MYHRLRDAVANLPFTTEKKKSCTHIRTNGFFFEILHMQKKKTVREFRQSYHDTTTVLHDDSPTRRQSLHDDSPYTTTVLHDDFRIFRNVFPRRVDIVHVDVLAAGRLDVHPVVVQCTDTAVLGAEIAPQFGTQCTPVQKIVPDDKYLKRNRGENMTRCNWCKIIQKNAIRKINQSINRSMDKWRDE